MDTFTEIGMNRPVVAQGGEPDEQLAQRIEAERNECMAMAAQHREQRDYHDREAGRYERMAESLGLAVDRLTGRDQPPVPSSVGPTQGQVRL